MTTQWGQHEAGRRQAFERALDVSGAGSVLSITAVDRMVQQLHLRELGASAVLERRRASGPSANVNRRTPGTDAQWLNDTTEPTSVEGSYARYSVDYKTLLTRGTVTRKLRAIGASYGDAFAEELSGRMGDFNQTFESGLITGDVAVSALQYDGLITSIQATASQIVLQTTNVAGDAFTADKLEEAIDLVKGASNRSDLVILASFKAQRMINAAMQNTQQFNDSVEVGAGFRVRSYDRIPIVTTTGMPDDLTFDGTKVTAYSGAATTAIMVVNRRYCRIDELTPVRMQPLANKSSQYDEFDIFWDGAYVHANPLGASILVGLTTA